MNYKRIIQSIRMMTIYSSVKRTEFLRNRDIFAHIGEGSTFHPRHVPLYPKLIKIHNNVRIAANVTFLTHDIIYRLLNYKMNTNIYKEKLGCIEIMDNVFIGSNSIIMYNVRINSNVIVAAGSVITKDLECDSVYAGVPAQKIGRFDEYVRKAKEWSDTLPKEISMPRGQKIEQDLCMLLWDRFEQERQ